MHIGQHKTGSKALQSFLTQNSKALSKRGIWYPSLNPKHPVKAFEISHFKFFALLRYQAMQRETKAEELERFWKQHQKICTPHTSVDQLLEELKQQCIREKSTTMILSAEDVFDMHTAHESSFNPNLIRHAAQLLKESCTRLVFDPVIVLYVRRQDYLLVAHYNQYLKGSEDTRLDFEGFFETFSPRLDTLKILQQWAEIFGEENFIVRPYESVSLPEGIVPDFFDKVLGFQVPPSFELPKKDIETVNATPSRDYMEFIRIQKQQGSGRYFFPQELVLQAALQHRKSGWAIADWMPSAARRSLLETYEVDNQAICEIFIAEKGRSVFQEKLPDADASNLEYSGLSPEKAMEISWEVHRLLIGEKKKRILRKIGQTALGAVALLVLIAILYWVV